MQNSFNRWWCHEKYKRILISLRILLPSLQNAIWRFGSGFIKTSSFFKFLQNAAILWIQSNSKHWSNLIFIGRSLLKNAYIDTKSYKILWSDSYKFFWHTWSKNWLIFYSKIGLKSPLKNRFLGHFASKLTYITIVKEIQMLIV